MNGDSVVTSMRQQEFMGFDLGMRPADVAQVRGVDAVAGVGEGRLSDSPIRSSASHV